MARKPRIHYAGAVHHVLIRGNARQKIFFETADYLRFLRFMGEAIEKYNCRVHAFCLMPNHIHMAIQVGKRFEDFRHEILEIGQLPAPPLLGQGD